MKKLLLLLLFPLALHAQLPKPQYVLVPGEYKFYAVNPVTKQLYEATQGIYVAGAPAGIVSGSANIHHASFIGPDGSVYVIGDNPSNISATGSTAATLPFTKTPVGNAKQVVAFDNNGTTGYGELVVTNDGKVVLMGCSQSGFRGDGTEGNAAEPVPYTIQVPKPITKIVAGSYVFALSTDGTVYRWGGTRADQSWAPYSCGAFSATPDLTHIGIVNLPEPIVDIIGGGDWSYAVGKSGEVYGWAYGPLWLGTAGGTSNQLGYFKLSGMLKPLGTLQNLSVGPEATYALMTNGDVWAWGNNTQAAIGNGQEAAYVQQTHVADWGWTSRSLMVTTPVKINPAGVAFDNISTSIGDAFYAYAEDTKGNLWNWGRNKGYVLWNGQGGTSAQQSSTPNAWDVTAPEKITAFGPISAPPPPPANLPPVAKISGPTSQTLPADTIVLDGSGSTDPDGLIATYSFQQLSGAPSVLVQSGSKATVYATAAGIYTFRLTVVDNQGLGSSTTVSVVINPYPPCPVCPICPPQRSVTAVSAIINGVTYPIPLSWLTISY